MAQDISVVLRPPNTTVSTFDVVIDDLIAVRFSDEDNVIGDGSFTIHDTHPNVGDLELNQTVLFRLNGTIINGPGFEIQSIDHNELAADTELSNVVTVSGPGLIVTLGNQSMGGGIVFPTCGDPTTFTEGTRWFGWMSCCCYNPVGFVSPPAFVDRLNDPNPPFKLGVPEGYPDLNAWRIWGDAPNAIESGANEIQEVEMGTSINSGTFVLSANGGTTAPISSPWSAANVESALEALPQIDGVTVTGSGLNGDGYVIEFDTGNVAGKSIGLIGVDHSSLDHPPQTARVTRIQAGARGRYSSTPGRHYFRKTFALDEDKNLVLFVNLSRSGAVYMDGELIYQQTSASAAAGFDAIPVSLAEGDHCLAIKGETRSGLGWALATLASASEAKDGTWTLGGVVVRTDSSWEVLSTALSVPEPGMTVEEIITCIVDENAGQPTPSLDHVTLSFPDAFDDQLVYGVQVGTGLLDVLDELRTLAGITSRYNAATHTLTVHQDGDLASSAEFDFVDDVTDLSGGIIASSTMSTGHQANTFLIETRGGVTEREIAASVAEIGARRIGVSLGTLPSTDTIAQFMNAAQRVYTSTHLRVCVVLSVPGLVPYTDYRPGSLVTAPVSLMRPGTAWRVRSLQVQMGVDGVAMWTLFQEKP